MLRRPAEALGAEAQPVADDLGARDRDPPEVLGHQATDGLDVLVVDRDVEQLSEVVDREPRADPHAAAAQLLDLVGVDVVLVGDLADDLLEQVLDGDQAGGAAVLVDDDRDVGAASLHVAHQLVGRLGVGHEEARAHHRLDALGRLGVAVVEDPLRDVLEVGDADDVVEVVADHGDAGEAAAQRERQQLPQRLVPLDEHHVGARHHHLADQGVAELEDRVDHPALGRLDHPRLLRQVDQLAQLGLGRERALAEALARA